MGTWWTSLTARGRAIAGLVAAIAVVGLLTAALALSSDDDDGQDVRADGTSSSSSSSSSTSSSSSSSSSTTLDPTSTSSSTLAADGGTTTTTRRPRGGSGSPGRTATTAPTATQGTTATTAATTTTAARPCNSSSSGPRGQLSDLFCSRRSSTGKPKMVRTAGLDAVAQQWAEKLAGDKKLSHRSDLQARVLAACEGPCNGWAENVAFGGDVSTIWSQWLNSQVHRDNIDAPYPGEYGFGVAVADDGSLYAVQNFGQYR